MAMPERTRAISSMTPEERNALSMEEFKELLTEEIFGRETELTDISDNEMRMAMVILDMTTQMYIVENGVLKDKLKELEERMLDSALRFEERGIPTDFLAEARWCMEKSSGAPYLDHEERAKIYALISIGVSLDILANRQFHAG